MQKALISRVTAQKGSYLTELLLDKGYEVHGTIRRSSSFNTARIDHVTNDEKFKDQFFFDHDDITDSSNINRLLEQVEPDEIYNLAAQSYVTVSFDISDYTVQVDLSIKDISLLVSHIVCFKGSIRYDKSNPNGTPRKLRDNARINKIGWQSTTAIQEGILKTYNWYKDYICSR